MNQTKEQYYENALSGSLSGDQYLTCGIPQGTILGPLTL